MQYLSRLGRATSGRKGLHEVSLLQRACTVHHRGVPRPLHQLTNTVVCGTDAHSYKRVVV